MVSSIKLSRRSFILSSLALAACKPGSAVLKLSGNTMGTNYSVIALDNGQNVDNAALQKAITNSLSSVNVQMSNWDATSEVSRFNAAGANSPVAVSPQLVQVVEAALDINTASEGQFDISLGSVIETWGFGANTHGYDAEPDAALLAAALATTGTSGGLRVENGALLKSNPDTQIYLSSIGKGFGVDQVANTLKGFGLTNFMIEIGGDLYVAGRNSEGQPWQIGIESPDALSRQTHQVAQISDLGMATSGDYRNYFENDGVRYSHIIDAKTGRPITHTTASVTVLAENTMLADAWATALLVHGTNRGLEMANDLGLAALFIDRDAQNGFVTSTSESFVSLQS